MTNFFNGKWIVHKTSYVETSKQNSIVECKHHRILSIYCALIFFNLNWLFVFCHMLSNTLFI